jgi:FkbM family methyltransferase
MSAGRFVSYGQNNEDVVLWRALRHVAAGHYVEVGANDPELDSVTRAFYDHGWSGVTVEPVPQFAALHREQRSRDLQIEAAVTSAPGPEVVLHMFTDTGLSTLVDSISDQHATVGLQAEDVTVPTARLDDLLAATGWGHSDIQFMLIDVEGAEADVLSTVDLSVWRPWVLVIEATVPTSTAGSDLRPESTADAWEPAVLAAGYEFCLFDGVSRFYVAKEHSELRPLLSYPACALDDFARFPEEKLKAQHSDQLAAAKAQHSDQLAAANRQALYWRSVAIRSWGNAMVDHASEVAALRKAISVMRGTVSWRVTGPLRKVRKVQRALARRVRR